MNQYDPRQIPPQQYQQPCQPTYQQMPQQMPPQMPAEKKSPAVMTVLSAVPLVLSVIGILFSLLLFAVTNSTTNDMNEVVLSVAGMILFVAFSWVFAGLAILTGFVMAIVSAVSKHMSTVFMPLLGVVIGIIAAVINCSVM